MRSNFEQPKPPNPQNESPSRAHHRTIAVSEKNESLAEKARQEIEHSFNEAAENYHQFRLEQSISIEARFGREALEIIDQLKSLAEKQYRERGITDIKLPEILLAPETIADKRLVGLSLLTHIEMYLDDIEDKEISLIQFLKTLGHEIYHSMGRISYDTKGKKTLWGWGKYKFNDADVVAMGASYYIKDEQGALEEGLAVQFEDILFEKIRATLKQDSLEKYDKIIEGHKDELNSSHKYKDQAIGDSIFIVSLGGANKPDIRYAEASTQSKRLVEYLAQEIPDFYTLVEKARAHRKTLSLARAIETRFGVGSYRKITTTPQEKAEELLIQLKVL